MINGMAYGVFAVAAAAAGLVLCFRHQKPKWWPLFVLVCPPAIWGLMPDGKGKKALGSFVIFLFAGAVAAEVYVYRQHHHKGPYDHLPPIIRKMIGLNDDVRQTTIDLYTAANKLDSLGMNHSRISDVRTGLAHIRRINELLKENQQAIQRLILFVEDHADFINRQQMEWAFLIKRFYRDPLISRHSQYRLQYLSSFENLLQYIHDHYEQIMEHKSHRHLANYDAWYLRHRSIGARLNLANRKRIEYQNAFVAAHPTVKPFLPGTHHLAPFKFWDRFNF